MHPAHMRPMKAMKIPVCASIKTYHAPDSVSSAFLTAKPQIRIAIPE
jgi:hypothetical protein